LRTRKGPVQCAVEREGGQVWAACGKHPPAPISCCTRHAHLARSALAAPQPPALLPLAAVGLPSLAFPSYLPLRFFLPLPPSLALPPVPSDTQSSLQSHLPCARAGLWPDAGLAPCATPALYACRRLCRHPSRSHPSIHPSIPQRTPVCGWSPA